MRTAKPSRYLLLASVGLILLLGFSLLGQGIFLPSGPEILPTLSPQRRLLAADQNQQRPVQALYHLEALADEHGWTPDLHRKAGDTWAQLGDMEQALFHWSQVPTDDPLLLRSVSEAYIQRGAWTDAVTTLSQLIEVQPDNTWASYHLGMILAPYDPERAQGLLQQAALDPIYHDAARAVRVTLLENRDDEIVNSVGLPILVGLVLVEQEVWPYAEIAFTHANTLFFATNNEPLPEALA
jgi:tetratricopeptide (TPR) repeat protein